MVLDLVVAVEKDLIEELGGLEGVLPEQSNIERQHVDGLNIDSSQREHTDIDQTLFSGRPDPPIYPFQVPPVAATDNLT